MERKCKKVELLAPAGNFDALRGALRAGADAVYLGGRLFGARAYADNFSDEEICGGIRLAHILGKKIYLTVNTLVKEKELDGLCEYLQPFYECGLDGVIVQDLGALALIRRNFPGLELHASTQMTITGSYGANLLKEHGVVRVVPARELSLGELEALKNETQMELEVFIHGAMCYCYSGQCLFSSLLGGRSGNRGRCAQPCRLPYAADGGKTEYPLSMKDMCTIDLLPELIGAGIDSLKIEGRMKKPEYAAGVTALYRKYIDLYYENGEYRVSQEDRAVLAALYIRSEAEEGYYHRTNGKEMISLCSPAYKETGEKLLEEIRRRYVKEPITTDVCAEITLRAGEPAELTLKKVCGGKEIAETCRGTAVERSLKQPLTRAKITEQIQKSGNTLLGIKKVKIEMEEAVFMPIRALNELRREAVGAMENRLILEAGFEVQRKGRLNDNMEPGSEKSGSKEQGSEKRESEKTGRYVSQPQRTGKKALHVLVMTIEQLRAAIACAVDRIYLDHGLAIEKEAEIREIQSKAKEKGVYTELFLATPYIVRKKDIPRLEKLEQLLEEGIYRGILIRNMESLAYFGKENTKHLALDANLYIWNRESAAFFSGYGEEIYLPVEENLHEWKELLASAGKEACSFFAVTYGRLPMMITANCIKKTKDRCDKTPGIARLTDRYQKHFPVYTDCRCCYNIIYNSVPLSLHRIYEQKELLLSGCRLDFSLENEEQTGKVIRYFQELAGGYKEPFYKEYTTGHYKRGVE